MNWLRRHRGVAAGVVLSVAAAATVYLAQGPGTQAPQWTYRSEIASSTANLPQSITINSQTVSPTLLYRGQDATTSAWTATVGENLTIAGAGAAPTVDLPAPLTAGTDEAITVGSDNRYEASTGAFGAPGSDDWVLEFVAKTPVTDGTIAGTTSNAPALPGWKIYQNSTISQISVRGAGATTVNVNSSAHGAGNWNHYLFVYDASGSAQWYINGVASGSPTAVSAVGSISNSHVLALANTIVGTDPYNGHLAYLALWQKSAWLDTHLQPTVAKRRFFQLAGIYPQLSADSTITYARASTAYLRNEQPGVDTSLFLVGAGWPRVEQVGDYVGYLSEPATKNDIPESEEFTGAAGWGLISGPSVTPDLTAAPDGAVTADRIILWGSSYLFSNAAGLPSGATQSVSIYVKQITTTGTFKIQNPNGAADGEWTVDASLLSGGWDRLTADHAAITVVAPFKNTGTNGGIQIGPSTPGGVQLYAWGAQYELGSHVTSYVATGGAATTRTADTLTIPALDNVGDEGSPRRLEVRHTLRVDDIDHPGDGVIWSISDDTVGDSLILSLEPGDVLRARSFHLTGDEGDVTGTTDISDGAAHKVIVRVQAGKLTLYVDGNLEGTDSTASTPDGLKSIDIGHAWDDLGQPIASIGDLRINPQQTGDDQPLFWVVADADDTSGLQNLPTMLRINGLSLGADFVYEGKNATTSTWTATVGSDLSIAGAGADPIVDQAAPFTVATDKSVDFEAGKSFQAGSNTPGDIATEDFVIEAVAKASAGASLRMIAKRIGTSGYFVYSTADKFALWIQDGSGSAQVLSSALTVGAWYHVMFFVDRSGSAEVYVNGTSSGSAVVSGTAGTLTVATPLTIGARSVLSLPWDESVAHVAMWKRDDFLDTHLQPTVAKDRFLRLTGIYPQLSADSTITYARASTAYLRNEQPGVDTSLFLVGAGWPRVEQVDGIIGYLSEPVRTNYLSNSEDLSAWTVRGTAVVTADQTVAPDGNTTADYVSVSTIGNDVFTTYSVVYATPLANFAPSLYLKKITATGTLNFQNPVAVTGTWQVDFSLLGSGWERITRDHHAVTVNTEMQHSAPGDGGIHLLTSGATLEFYAWGGQSEDDTRVSTSYIETGAAAIETRTADTLTIPALDNVGDEGSPRRLEVRHTLRVDDIDHPGDGVIWSISDDTVGDSLILSLEPGDVLRARSFHLTGDEGDVTGTTDISDGAAHKVIVSVQAGELTLYVDGNLEGTDTSASTPDGLKSIDIGHAWDDLGQPIASIGDLRINPQQTGADQPTFHLVAEGDSTSGLKNLPTMLRINGLSLGADFVYEGKNATTSTWTATIGSDLSISGAGADPIVDQPVPFTVATDTSVDFETGKGYQAATSTPGDVATEDMVLEAVLTFGGGSAPRVFDKRGATGTGYTLYETASQYVFLVHDGTNPLQFAYTPAEGVGTWMHLLVFADKSGSAQFYLNGVAVGTAANLSAVGSLSNSNNLSIGMRADGSDYHAGKIAHVAMWKRDDFLDTHLQPTVAKDRFLRLTGIYPQLARGTAIPTTATRASTAHLDIERSGVVTLFPVGTNWLRVVRRSDATTPTANMLVGYLAEEARTNFHPNSSGPLVRGPLPWVTADKYVAPDGSQTADEGVFSTPAEGYDGSSYGGAVVGKSFTVSAWLRRISGGNEIYFGTTDQTTWTGQTQTKITFTDEWKHYFATHVLAGPGTAVDFIVGTLDRTGLGNLPNTTIAVWGYQIEEATLPSSYIATTGVAATRARDNLTFGAGQNVGSENPSAVTMYSDVLVPDNSSPPGYQIAMEVSDNSTSDRLNIYSNITTGYPVSDSIAGGLAKGNVVGTTRITDGKTHQFKSTIQANELTLYVDESIVGTPDTTDVVIGGGLTDLDIGQRYNSDLQLNGVIGNAQCFPAIQTQTFTPSWSN